MFAVLYKMEQYIHYNGTPFNWLAMPLGAGMPYNI